MLPNCPHKCQGKIGRKPTRNWRIRQGRMLGSIAESTRWASYSSAWGAGGRRFKSFRPDQIQVVSAARSGRCPMNRGLSNFLAPSINVAARYAPAKRPLHRSRPVRTRLHSLADRDQRRVVSANRGRTRVNRQWQIPTYSEDEIIIWKRYIVPRHSGLPAIRTGYPSA